MSRQRMLKKKIAETHKSLLEVREKLKAFEDLRVTEEAGVQRRLNGLREEVGAVLRREREVMEVYRETRDKIMDVESGVDGHGVNERERA